MTNPFAILPRSIRIGAISTLFLIIIGTGVYSLATTVSKDLSITITPSSGNIPAPAVAAGFTKTAIDTQFSQAGTYSTLSNWLGGCGGPTSGFRWTAQFLGSGSAPCGQINVEMDNNIGQSVLHLHQDPIFNQVNRPIIAFPDLPFGSNGNFMPVEGYYEITFRITAASLNQPDPNHPFDIFTYFNATGPNHNNWWEPDHIETQPTSSSVPDWVDGGLEWHGGSIVGGIGTPSVPSGANHSTFLESYHTIGTLFTSNGSILWKCYYIDNAATSGCASYTANDSSIFSFHDQVVIVGWSQSKANGGADVNITNPIDIYIKNIRIFECPTWPATGCHGTLITH